MMRYFICLAGLLLLVSCNNNANDKTEAVEDTADLEMAAPKLSFTNHFPELQDYFTSQDTSFRAASFEAGEIIVKEDSALVWPLDAETYNTFASYFLFNADSSYALDLVSYNFIPVKKNGKTVMQGADPDFEVAIIDMKKKTRSRLFFLGSSGGNILDAKWLDASNVLIAGAMDWNDTDSLRPAVWQYNVLEKTWQPFLYPEKIKASWSGYEKKVYELNR